MYENNFKNLALAKSKELDSFLKLIADLNEDIEFFAMGGTAMVISGIKESTKDVDFLTTAKYKDIKQLFELAGLKEESPSKLCNIWRMGAIRIDIFYDAFILGTALPDDWKMLSEHVKDIGRLKLYILNWYDVIITKIARSELRDIDDCLDIIKRRKINLKKLKKRYYELAEVSLIADYDIKFKHLMKQLK